MTLTIRAPEVERKLQDAAAERGMEAEEYLLQLVVDALADRDQTRDPAKETLSKRPLYETGTPADLKAALDRWAARHSTDTPLIPDEALRRENLYEDRGL